MSSYNREKECDYLMCIFERLRALDKDPVEGSHPGADHDRGGRGQAQGTGTRDGQDAQRTPERVQINNFL